MLGDASLAPSAVLAPQRCADHTSHAEVGFIEFPHANQLVDNRFLLGNPIHLGHKTRIIDHANDVEVCSQAVERDETDVQQPVGFGITWIERQRSTVTVVLSTIPKTYRRAERSSETR